MSCLSSRMIHTISWLQDLLPMSYCDHLMSVVNNCFKGHLLLIYWLDFYKTWQELSLIFGMKHYLVDRYQVCLNYATLGQKGLPQGSHVLHRFILEKHEKIFLFETTRPNLDIWYIASSSGPLPSLFKLCPWGQKIGIRLI